jgi:hypothetical protein
MSGEATTTDLPAPATPASAAKPVAGSALLVNAGSLFAALWSPTERVLVRLGDYLNPILVKETRQALKSFQFTITFVLVLVACWVVTIGGVAVIGPGIFYSASGGTMLYWYYLILLFPLAVVVPYSAFRSLAAEREDNTYDLLSITTLKPRQIISGKLGSSVVQMAVYFSAIAPCLAFTFLLRGVDVLTIGVLLVYTFFGSFGLSMVGLLLATLSRQRIGQVFVSVAFIAFLLWVFFVVAAIVLEVVRASYSYLGDSEFWIVTLVLLTAYATTFALAYFAAAGMITFPSENRSTPLRICMIVQQVALIGWLGYLWVEEDFGREAALVLAMLSGAYWYVMGAMLTAELPEMSRRVKRSLPSSFFGRVFLSWLNPGPASGYMFAVASASAVVVICLLAAAINELFAPTTGRWPSTDELIYLLVIGWGYLVAYLGLGLIVVTALRRIAVVTMLACVLIHFLLVLAGSGIPMAFQMMSVELRNVDYSYLQIANPFWSLIHVANGGMLSEGPVLLVLVPAAAICMLLLNLRAVAKELREVRIAPPPRVVEDEAVLHPPPEQRPTNPWDVRA